MRWNPSNIMNNLLKAGSSAHDRRNEPSLETIRFAMLRVLGEDGAVAYPVIQLRVTYAEDIHDLWYLRGDVMAAVAAQNGEVFARRELSTISAMFTGLLPSGLTARTSPLGH
jgi:hypothetical protein